MTAHTETHAPEVAHDAGHGSADPLIQVAEALKFEPVELQEFQAADKTAGQMMGKLLGFLFCVLLTLMTGVNIWMIGRQAKGTDDPQGPIKATAEATPGHH